MFQQVPFSGPSITSESLRASHQSEHRGQLSSEQFWNRGGCQAAGALPFPHQHIVWTPSSASRRWSGQLKMLLPQVFALPKFLGGPGPALVSLCLLKAKRKEDK